MISAIGFGSLVYGLSEVGLRGEHGRAYAALAIGVVGIACFVWRQLLLQREDRPLLDLRTLKEKVFTLSVAAMAIAFMAMLGSMILLQLYLQNVRGLRPWPPASWSRRVAWRWGCSVPASAASTTPAARAS